MTFYHATYADRVAAIQKEGLKPTANRNFPDAEPGVYLSTDPVIALSILIEHGMAVRTAESPKALAESFRIIVIDRSRVREDLLEPDPQVDGLGGVFWLYRGAIDVTAMPVVNWDVLSNQ